MVQLPSFTTSDDLQKNIIAYIIIRNKIERENVNVKKKNILVDF